MKDDVDSLMIQKFFGFRLKKLMGLMFSLLVRMLWLLKDTHTLQEF